MNRRNFLTALFGLTVAPAVAVKVLSASPSTPKYNVYRDKHYGPVGYKARVFMRAGVINAPYIPLYITSNI
jgi:hypothetical protein